jgi:hypothetical protein
MMNGESMATRTMAERVVLSHHRLWRMDESRTRRDNRATAAARRRFRGTREKWRGWLDRYMLLSIARSTSSLRVKKSSWSFVATEVAAGSLDS